MLLVALLPKIESDMDAKINSMMMMMMVSLSFARTVIYHIRRGATVIAARRREVKLMQIQHFYVLR
jgi:hypothetical protein